MIRSPMGLSSESPLYQTDVGSTTSAGFLLGTSYRWWLEISSTVPQRVTKRVMYSSWEAAR